MSIEKHLKKTDLENVNKPRIKVFLETKLETNGQILWICKKLTASSEKRNTRFRVEIWKISLRYGQLLCKIVFRQFNTNLPIGL